MLFSHQAEEEPSAEIGDTAQGSGRGLDVRVHMSGGAVVEHEISLTRSRPNHKSSCKTFLEL